MFRDRSGPMHALISAVRVDWSAAQPPAASRSIAAMLAKSSIEQGGSGAALHVATPATNPNKLQYTQLAEEAGGAQFKAQSNPLATNLALKQSSQSVSK